MQLYIEACCCHCFHDRWKSLRDDLIILACISVIAHVSVVLYCYFQQYGNHYDCCNIAVVCMCRKVLKKLWTYLLEILWVEWWWVSETSRIMVLWLLPRVRILTNALLVIIMKRLCFWVVVFLARLFICLCVGGITLGKLSRCSSCRTSVNWLTFGRHGLGLLLIVNSLLAIMFPFVKILRMDSFWDKVSDSDGVMWNYSID